MSATEIVMGGEDAIMAVPQTKYYKILPKSLNARGFQYNENEIATVEGMPKARKHGLHYCRTLWECLQTSRYKIDDKHAVFEVEPLGDIDECPPTCATNRLRFVRRIPLEEAKAMVDGWREFVLNVGSHAQMFYRDGKKADPSPGESGYRRYVNGVLRDERWFTMDKHSTYIYDKEGNLVTTKSIISPRKDPVIREDIYHKEGKTKTTECWFLSPDRTELLGAYRETVRSANMHQVTRVTRRHPKFDCSANGCPTPDPTGEGFTTLTEFFQNSTVSEPFIVIQERHVHNEKNPVLHRNKYKRLGSMPFIRIHDRRKDIVIDVFIEDDRLTARTRNHEWRMAGHVTKREYVNPIRCAPLLGMLGFNQFVNTTYEESYTFSPTQDLPYLRIYPRVDSMEIPSAMKTWSWCEARIMPPKSADGGYPVYPVILQDKRVAEVDMSTLRVRYFDGKNAVTDWI